MNFTSNGQVVLSASLDGTVRAFDLNRLVIEEKKMFTERL